MPLQPLAGDPLTPIEMGVSLPVPLLDCRHYVVNFLDLFRNLLGRIYTQGGSERTFLVGHRRTIGDALAVREASAAAALAADEPDGSESPLLALVRHLAEEQGLSDTLTNSVVGDLKSVLSASATGSTFAEKADFLEGQLAALDIPDAGRFVDLLRLLGGIVSSFLDFTFEPIKDLRIDYSKHPTRYMLVDGAIDVVLEEDPDVALSVEAEPDEDHMEVRLKLRSATLASDATVRFFKIVDGEKKEKYELLLDLVADAIGSVEVSG